MSDKLNGPTDLVLKSGRSVHIEGCMVELTSDVSFRPSHAHNLERLADFASGPGTVEARVPTGVTHEDIRSVNEKLDALADKMTENQSRPADDHAPEDVDSVHKKLDRLTSALADLADANESTNRLLKRQADAIVENSLRIDELATRPADKPAEKSTETKGGDKKAAESKAKDEETAGGSKPKN